MVPIAQPATLECHYKKGRFIILLLLTFATLNDNLFCFQGLSVNPSFGGCAVIHASCLWASAVSLTICLFP